MRLITRANLDGVTCAVFITLMESIEQVIFANPQDIEDGTVAVRMGDAIANLPYHPNAALWFSHHDKAEGTPDLSSDLKGKWGVSPSASRLVYEYYDSHRLQRYDPMLRVNDRIDSAKLDIDDILNPTGWVLLSFTLDPFMGLSAFHGYANSIIAALKTGSSIEHILEMSEVKSRVKRYFQEINEFQKELVKVTRLEDNVIISDFRQGDMMPMGNRFIAFALFPGGNVQVGISYHKDGSELRVRLGKSIINRSCTIHLGHLASGYGGGGLNGAAGISFNPSDPETENRISEIIARLKA